MKRIKQDFRNLLLKLRFKYYKIFRKSVMKPSFSDTKEGYVLDFQDNFDTFNTKVWDIKPIWGSFHPGSITGTKKEAPVVYWGDPNTQEVVDGKLILKSYRTNTEVNYTDFDGVDYGNYIIPYSVGWVSTASSYNTKYGYFEISCKIPKGEGIWNAFWLASNYDWPPEIDMFEFWTHKPWYNIFNTNQRKMKSGIYAGSESNTKKFPLGIFGKSDLAIRSGFTRLPKNITETFNKYAVEWDENGVYFYFNDILVFRDNVNSLHESLHKYPMHIILNHGVTDKSDVSKLPDVMTNMEVDYVRVWKKI